MNAADLIRTVGHSQKTTFAIDRKTCCLAVTFGSQWTEMSAAAAASDNSWLKIAIEFADDSRHEPAPHAARFTVQAKAASARSEVVVRQLRLMLSRTAVETVSVAGVEALSLPGPAQPRNVASY
jgi:hypothetical protein